MGFKKTSDIIAVSFRIDEVVLGTTVQNEIALQLDVLNNEIFVVLAVDLDLTPPDAILGVDSNTFGSLSSTAFNPIVVGNLSNSNVVAVARDSCRGGVVSYERGAGETYQGSLDWIALIATNNFFIQLVGQNNIQLMTMTGRVWGYRAVADSSTYAALVQSEVLSA